MVTKNILAEKIKQYIYHSITLAQLVDWSEKAMMDEDFDEKDHDVIKNTIAALGVADVKSFGLSLEDYETLLSQLGYRLKYTVEKV